MDIGDIDLVFEAVNRKGEFYCTKTLEDDNVIVYKAEKFVRFSGEQHRIVIDINLYREFNVAVLVMVISQGYWGNGRDKIGELLLRMNSITRTGNFAIWQQNGDIIYKNDIPISRLDTNTLLQNLKFFETVYISVKPRLEAYANQLGLRSITSEEHAELSREINKFYNSIQRKLPK